MKNYSLKPLFLMGILFSISLCSQGQSGANSFPATGNVTVGTSTASNTLTVYGTVVQTGGTATATTGTTTYMQTNVLRQSSQIFLNPGILLFPSTSSYNFGIDLGYNATSARARTRIFAPAAYDVVLSSALLAEEM